MLRVARKRLHPAAQLRLMNTKVFGSLYIGHAAFLDQSHSLKLELARKLPSLHDPPPVPSKHLTRCLRNRQQATRSSARKFERSTLEDSMRKKTGQKKQKCKNCEGKGTLKKGDKIVRCQRCGGSGSKP